MRRFEAEPTPTKPDGFDDWLCELGLIADTEGPWVLILVWANHAPIECCRYLATLPGVWQGLLTRALHADHQRYDSVIGRRVGT